MELDFHHDPSILGDIVDAMAVGVFTVDAQGRFVAWSGGAERVTGYTRAEVIGRPCDILEGPNCKGFGTLAELLRAPPPLPAGICNQECKVLGEGWSRTVSARQRAAFAGPGRETRGGRGVVYRRHLAVAGPRKNRIPGKAG